jgi:hypothetical protein
VLGELVAQLSERCVQVAGDLLPRAVALRQPRAGLEFLADGVVLRKQRGAGFRRVHGVILRKARAALPVRRSPQRRGVRVAERA